jgi:hypothetical protein
MPQFISGSQTSVYSSLQWTVWWSVYKSHYSIRLASQITINISFKYPVSSANSVCSSGCLPVMRPLEDKLRILNAGCHTPRTYQFLQYNLLSQRHCSRYFHYLLAEVSREATKHRSRVVNAPVSHSGRTGFRSRPGVRLAWLRCFVILLSPSR